MMIPSELIPYHDSLTAMRSEFDALTIDLASVCTSASRLANAATKAAKAIPYDAEGGPPLVAGSQSHVYLDGRIVGELIECHITKRHIHMAMAYIMVAVG